MQLCVVLPLESFGRNQDNGMVLLKPNQLTFELYISRHHALQNFDWKEKSHDPQFLAAYSLGNFYAGSWRYFLTVVSSSIAV